MKKTKTRYDVALSDQKDVKNSEIGGSVVQGNGNTLNSTTYVNPPSQREGFASTSIGGIQFNPYIFREVVIAACDKLIEDAKPIEDFTIIDIKEKNEINGLSEEFYNDFMATEVEPYLYLFDEFLQNRVNEDLHSRVQNAVQALNKTIAIKRRNFNSFEEILDELCKSIVERDFITLADKEKEVFFFLCYLYVSCFIGKKTISENRNVTATQTS